MLFKWGRSKKFKTRLKKWKGFANRGGRSELLGLERVQKLRAGVRGGEGCGVTFYLVGQWQTTSHEALQKSLSDK